MSIKSRKGSSAEGLDDAQVGGQFPRLWGRASRVGAAVELDGELGGD